MYKIGLAEIKLINVVSSIMNKFLSFAKQALYFAGRAAVAGVLPAIATYYWTSSNHYNYWDQTIFAVQTIDFKILANTLPTKLSALIVQNDAEEIQRTLQSNTGRFGIVVTDCKIADKECPDQTVLYRTQSRSSWSRNFSMDLLKDAPFDVLRDPPPLKTEISFPDIRSREYKSTGQTNSGQIIGRVYYVRGIQPSYVESWTGWLQDKNAGVGSIYTTSVFTFLASWGLLILIVEIAILKINAKKRENERLILELEESKKEIEAKVNDNAKLLDNLRKVDEQKQKLLADLRQKVSIAEAEQASFEVARVANEYLEGELQKELEESRQKLTVHEQELGSNTVYIEDLKKKIASENQSEVAEYQQQLDEANSSQDRLIALIESQKHDIELKQQNLDDFYEDKTALESKLTNVATKINSDKLKVANLETDIEGLQDSITKIEAQKQLAETKAQELQENLDSALNSKAKLQSVLDQLNKDEHALKEKYEQQLQDKSTALINEYANDVDRLEKEIIQLKWRIDELEGDLKSARADLHPEVAEIPIVDISSLFIGFVGGHAKTMNRVINRLQKEHGLKNYVLLEAGYDHNQSIFRAKLTNCNLIVFVSGYAGHHYFNMLQNLQNAGTVTKEMIILSRAAESGIVREVIKYAQNLNKRDAA